MSILLELFNNHSNNHSSSLRPFVPLSLSLRPQYLTSLLTLPPLLFYFLFFSSCLLFYFLSLPPSFPFPFSFSFLSFKLSNAPLLTTTLSSYLSGRTPEKDFSERGGQTRFLGTCLESGYPLFPQGRRHGHRRAVRVSGS